MASFKGTCEGTAAAKYDVWLEVTQNSQNKTNRTSNITVSLKLKRNDGYANSAWNGYSNQNEVKITVAGASVLKSNMTFDTRNGKTAVLGTWTGNVKHDSDGTYNKTIKGEFTTGNSSVSSGSAQGTFSATKMQPASTSCTAPTSVSASGIVTPNGTFTVSWAGAKAGTANPIAGYDVYYRITPGGLAPTTSAYTGKVSVGNVTSKTITLSGATRGSKVVCGVVLKQTVGDNLGIKTGGSVVINSLPGIPTVTTNVKTVPSSGGYVTFTVAPGADTNTSQTKTVRYKTSSSTPTTSNTSAMVSNTKLEIKSDTTYYFWTYDGLEFSSLYEKVEIKVNIKPSMSGHQLTSPSFMALNSNGEIGRRKGWGNLAKLELTSNKKGCRVKITPEFAETETTSSTPVFSSGAPLVSSVFTTSNNISLEYDMALVAKNSGYDLSKIKAPLCWRLRATILDEVEEGASIYLPSPQEFYAIPNAPLAVEAYSLDRNGNEIDTELICRKVRFVFDNDESMWNTSVSAKSNGKELGCSVESSSVENSKRTVDVALSSLAPSRGLVEFTVTLHGQNQNIKKEIKVEKQSIPHPFLTTLVHGAPAIKPFSDDGTFQCSVNWPFGNAGGIEEAWSSYFCKSAELVYSFSSTGADAFEAAKLYDEDNEINEFGKSGDQLVCEIKNPKTGGVPSAFNWADESVKSKFKEYVGTKPYYVAIRIVNLFKETYTSPWLSRDFNFDEKIEKVELKSIQWYKDNEGYIPLPELEIDGKEVQGMQEGVYLKFAFDISLYTTEDVRVYLKLTSKSGTETVHFTDFKKGELNYSTNGEVAKSENKTLVYFLKSVPEDDGYEWKVSAEGSGGVTGSDPLETAAFAQLPPSFEKIEYSTERDDNSVQALFVVKPQDKKSEIEYSLYEEGKGEIENSSFSKEGESERYTLDYDGFEESWNTKVFRIKAKSTLNILMPSEKVFYSESVTVFNLQPTIAYRKNQIGLNTKNPSAFSVVDIHQTTGKNCITFQGVDEEDKEGGVSTRFEMNVSKGTIEFYKDEELCFGLDLNKGQVYSKLGSEE